MTQHAGGHPRMGAADVIPFMPVRGVTHGGVRRARSGVRRELAETLDLPVYLYDRAALAARAGLARRRPPRRVRRAAGGGRAGERLPDFGPHAIGAAGATAVGARKPLVAFNVYLDGTDEAAAKEIASARAGVQRGAARGARDRVRGARTRWLRHGVDEPRRPRGDRAARRVRRGGALAADHGMAVTDSEIVGLVPAVRRSGPDDDRPPEAGRVRPGPASLERLVDAAEEANASVSESRTGCADASRGSARCWRPIRPRPAGARCGAIAGAAGAALIAMVGRLTIGKAGFEDLERAHAATWWRRPTPPAPSSSCWPTATPTPSTR